MGVLSQCYAKEKELTHELLTRELKPWGSTTLYSIADASQQMHFLGHSACQTKLNKIWMGRMALYTPMWKVLLYELLRLTFTCPFNSLKFNIIIDYINKRSLLHLYFLLSDITVPVFANAAADHKVPAGGGGGGGWPRLG